MSTRPAEQIVARFAAAAGLTIVLTRAEILAGAEPGRAVARGLIRLDAIDAECARECCVADQDPLLDMTKGGTVDRRSAVAQNY